METTASDEEDVPDDAQTDDENDSKHLARGSTASRVKLDLGAERSRSRPSKTRVYATTPSTRVSGNDATTPPVNNTTSKRAANMDDAGLHEVVDVTKFLSWKQWRHRRAMLAQTRGIRSRELRR